MPGRKRVVKGPDGSDLPGTELSFNPSLENWSEIMVEDGTVIRLKLVVTEVMRYEGLYDNEGNPVYRVGSQNVLVVSAPEELRKEASE